jgi:hypothetical protein
MQANSSLGGSFSGNVIGFCSIGMFVGYNVPKSDGARG